MDYPFAIVFSVPAGPTRASRSAAKKVSDFSYDYGLRLADRLAGPAPEAVLRSDRDRLVREIEDVARAEFYALFAAVASFAVYVDEVYFESPVQLGHVKFSFGSKAQITRVKNKTGTFGTRLIF